MPDEGIEVMPSRVEAEVMEFTISTDIDAPADQVWQLIGPQFGSVSTWARVVHTSAASGPADSTTEAPCAGRVCRVATPGMDQLSEEITAYDPQARSLSYVARHGMPRVVRSATSTWSVHESAANRSRFTMLTNVDLGPFEALLGRVIGRYLRRLGSQTGYDLKMFAESGKVSAEKPSTQAQPLVDRLKGLALANGLFSIATGTAVAAAPRWWSPHLADAPTWFLIALGLGVALYGLSAATYVRAKMTLTWGRTLAVLDAAWVVLVTALLAWRGATFSSFGLATTLITTAIVGWFGFTQWRAAQLASTNPAPGLESVLGR